MKRSNVTAREGRQQLFIPQPWSEVFSGGGELPHQRNTEKKPNQTNNNNKKSGKESTDGNFSRRLKSAAAVTYRDCSVAGERKRMHRGGGEGKRGMGIINHCQFNFISQENKKKIFVGTQTRTRR